MLITRPQPDADRTAVAFVAAGFSPVVIPLMRVAFRGGAFAGTTADALAFTSANGVRAYAAADTPSLPSYAVGPATAQAIEEAELPLAGVAGGDVASLAKLLGLQRPGHVLHVSGAAAAGDLIGALSHKGVPATRIVGYDVQAEEKAPDTLRGALLDGLAWVALYSPRSAALFGALVRNAGLSGQLASVRLAALSANVARAAADLPFASTRVAARPVNSALVDILSGRDT